MAAAHPAKAKPYCEAPRCFAPKGPKGPQSKQSTMHRQVPPGALVGGSIGKVGETWRKARPSVGDNQQLDQPFINKLGLVGKLVLVCRLVTWVRVVVLVGKLLENGRQMG